MTSLTNLQWLRMNYVGENHRGDFQEVHTSYLRLAAQAVAGFAAELGLDVPEIVWHTEGPAGGWVVEGENKIHLLTAVAQDWPKNWRELHWLIAHEMRHLWQIETLSHYGNRFSEEADAERWATTKTGYKCSAPYAVWGGRFSDET